MSTRRYRRQLVIIGTGGYGRELLDLVEAVNATTDSPTYDFLGFLDAEPHGDPGAPDPPRVARSALADVVPLADPKLVGRADESRACTSTDSPRVSGRFLHTTASADGPRDDEPDWPELVALTSDAPDGPTGHHGRPAPMQPRAARGRRWRRRAPRDTRAGEADLLARRGARLLGGLDLLATLEADYLIGVGSATARARVDRYASAVGRRPATLVHPRASIGGDVRLGPGTVICAFASVTTNVATGRHVLVDVGASVAHDCRVGDYATLAPGARISGEVELGPRVWIGSQAGVVRARRVGAGAVVGAGAIVVDDVLPDLVVAGIPARPITASDVLDGAVPDPSIALVAADETRPPAWPPPRHREPTEARSPGGCAEAAEIL